MTYNTRSPAVKRLMKEAQELSEPTELFYAKPLEDNLFEWHFTIRGPTDTDYDGGIYHGRILLPAEYPMKPPNILLMTPSGRFEINRKICLSISGYHPETWRPSWSIRTALLAIIGFMPTHGVGAIGSLDYPPEERRKLAKSSTDFVCPQCGGVKTVLKSLTEASVADVNEAKNLAAQISFTGDKAAIDKIINESNELQSPEKDQAPPIAPGPPNSVDINNQPITFNPVMLPMQPLSFEEWYYQFKCTPQSEQKGDDGQSTKPNIVIDAATVRESVPSNQSPVSDENGHVMSVDETVQEVEKSPESVPNVSSSETGPVVSTLHSEIVTEELRQRNAPQVVNSRPVVVATDNTANIDIASIRHRQSVLLKCIVFIAGILGFILAARLNNLTGEINH